MTQDTKSAVKPWWTDPGVILCVALATGFCSLAWPERSWAATIVVNSLEDTVVSGDGVCTLREAILNAEQDSHSGSTDCAAGHGADTITFTVSGTISLDSSLSITNVGGLTIDGGGGITTSGGRIGVGPAGVLTLTHLTVADGSGIGNSGALTLSHSTVSGHFTESGDGAISNSGTTTISNSTIRDNRNIFCGFGVCGSGIANRGTMTISTSTVSGNVIDGHPRTEAAGGAIYNAPGGTLTLSNSTVSGNGCGRFCAFVSGICNEGALTLSHSTVSDNGTGIFNSETLRLHSSLIADGCSGPVTSLGYNLDQAGSCGLTGPGDKSNIDPRLDPAGLKDNGGPTKTLALCTGSGTPAGCTGKSPAIDAIPTANCTGAGGNPLGTDQRGFFRPADGDRNGTALCDIGAVEANSAQLQTLNSLVTFTPLPATYQTSRDTTGCPAGSVGKFRFTADLANKPGSPPLSHVVAEVATLTKGNLVLNADGGLGGDGATVTFSPSGQYTDGVLTAKEHVGLPVTLCLKTFDQFTFFVDVLGTR
ncbi:MAG: CSLREA domain-containing protein [Nitrospira sp. BO4]|jgi:CSLREA domain-containing protein|nr:CSLREA domain-containing protein [Nitrospira sp. BO4]